jgi:hypothetical protein
MSFYEVRRFDGMGRRVMLAMDLENGGDVKGRIYAILRRYWSAGDRVAIARAGLAS